MYLPLLGVSMLMVPLLYNHPTLCFWRVVALCRAPADILSLFGCLFHVNPVAGTLSLLWLCWDSKDCHGRHNERSNRSKKKEESEVARSLHVLCIFVSRGFTKLVKLLALSYLQARRRSLRDSSLTGHSGQFVVNS